MSFDFFYYRNWIILITMIFTLYGIFIAIRESKVKKEKLNPLTFVLVFFFIVLFALLFVKYDTLTSNFDYYFNTIDKSKNYMDDNYLIEPDFYSIVNNNSMSRNNIIKRKNITLTILDDKKLEIRIKNINKDYLLNKDSKDPDFNICDSLTKVVYKHNGIVENPSSCLSDRSMKIIFHVKNP